VALATSIPLWAPRSAGRQCLRALDKKPTLALMGASPTRTAWLRARLAARAPCASQRLPATRAHRARCAAQVSAALLDPPSFYPDKLSVCYINGSSSTGPSPAIPRRYTLTHNDLTGALQLTIGREYNRQQISGLYNRLLRDEIKGEWVQGSGGPCLHVHCHVSGEERWLAPPILRNFIFRREMTLVSGPARASASAAWAAWRTCRRQRAPASSPELPAPLPRAQVLDTFLHADRELLRLEPELHAAQVLVHFHSDIQVRRCVWGGWGGRRALAAAACL
jgi:hypothetical protein